MRLRRARWATRARYLYSRLPWKQPRESVHEQNIWNLYLDVAWWGIANGVWITYLSVFAVRLGASTEWLGVLAALPALVNMVWSIPSARMVEAAPRRLPLTLRVGFLQRLAWLGVALVPFFFAGEAGVYAIVFIAGLTTIPAATAAVAFTSIMADLIPPEDRARVVSIRNVLLSATTTLTVLACGPILDALPFPISYQVVFGVSFLAALMSLRHVARLHVPEEVVVAHRERPKPWLTVNVRNAVREVLAARPFVKFVVSSVIFYWGIFFPSALFSIYRVRMLGATDTWIGLLTMVNSVVTIVFYAIWGRVAMRWGNRRVLIIGAFGMIAFPVLTGLSTSLPMLLIPSVIAGMSASAFNLAAFNEMLAVSPDAHRPRFIAIYTSAVNAVAFVAPLAGSYFATAAEIRLALYLGGAFRFLGAMAFTLMLGFGAKKRK